MESISLIAMACQYMGCPEPTIDLEDIYNNEYEGIDLIFNQRRYRSRRARKTPKKNGYFLAIWEKDTAGNNKPYDYENFPDYLIINIIDDQQKGQFIFPKVVLKDKGILRAGDSQGKMAFRVYAPWNKDLNSSAKKAAKWQQAYFVEIVPEYSEQLHILYHCVKG